MKWRREILLTVWSLTCHYTKICVSFTDAWVLGVKKRTVWRSKGSTADWSSINVLPASDIWWGAALKVTTLPWQSQIILLKDASRQGKGDAAYVTKPRTLQSVKVGHTDKKCNRSSNVYYATERRARIRGVLTEAAGCWIGVNLNQPQSF